MLIILKYTAQTMWGAGGAVPQKEANKLHQPFFFCMENSRLCFCTSTSLAMHISTLRIQIHLYFQILILLILTLISELGNYHCI